MLKRFYMVLGWLLLALPVLAQTVDDSSAADISSGAQPVNMGWLLVKTMAILIFIIILIFASVYLLKKYVFGTTGGVKQSDWMQILGQTQIMPKKFLVLVKVMDRILLVGLTDSSMQTIAEFEDETKIKPYLEKLQSKPGSWNESKFLGMIKKNLES